mmetsp:Transcript_34079/g.55556  ORF Transcript_34079/g.55556 Transcript_34079/m.55556 type:complete len:186 (+) Transcript_34079:62-619(+)
MDLPAQDWGDMNNVQMTTFTKLLQIVCKSLTSSSSAKVPQQQLSALQTELTAYDAKKMSGQLFCFISEVCRTDATNQTVSTTLDDYQLDKTHRDKIASALAHYKTKIRDRLAQTAVPISQLIGVEWRLCQDIKQQQIARINKPSYLIELKFNDGSKTFECGYEQLQDLLDRLKTARNSALRLLSQ